MYVACTLHVVYVCLSIMVGYTDVYCIYMYCIYMYCIYMYAHGDMYM